MIALYPYQLAWQRPDARWHKSKEQRGDYPFGSFMMNKKWALEEEMNNHLLRFQQVIITLFILVTNRIVILGWPGGN